MSEGTGSSDTLKMVTCGWCETKVFIPRPAAARDRALLEVRASNHDPMMLRQFELRSVIASGGNGTVYRAWDTVLERLVAVKLVKKELASDPGAMCYDGRIHGMDHWLGPGA